MTTPEADEQGRTARIELPNHQPTPTPPVPASPTEAAASTGPEVPPQHERPAEPPPPPLAPASAEDRAAVSPAPASAAAPTTTTVIREVPVGPQHEVVYVPLSASIGDGFKFGCGFFLATVLTVLVGFVLLAALFVLTGLFGLSLPLGR